MVADIVNEMTMERDHLEFSLGDTLDVKAGILLAVLTILGTLTGTLLTSSSLGKPSQWAQMISLTLLVFGCIFAVLTLVPRNYLLPELPDKYQKWAADIQQYYKDNPSEAESQTTNGITQITTERI